MLCPYCNSKIDHDTHTLTLTGSRLTVYEKVLASGPTGAHINELRRLLGTKASTIPVIVHYVNKAIAPLKIIRRNSFFRLRVEGVDK